MSLCQTRSRALLVTLLVICSAHGAVVLGADSDSRPAPHRECTSKEAYDAEGQSAPTSWQEFYAAYKRYGHCDTGAIAEGYSDFAATLAADQWDQLDVLDALTRAHPAFRKFVLDHLNVTMNLDQAQAIQLNASTRCPQKAKKLCSAILQRVKEATTPDPRNSR